MNTVVEIGVFRQIVNTFPLNRLIITETRPNWLQIRAVSPNLAVTVHACLARWHSGRCRRFDGLVTVAAVNAIVTHVMLMAELHRLLFLQITARQIRRPRDLRIRKKRSPGQNDNRDHAYPGNVVCTFLKKLCHF